MHGPMAKYTIFVGILGLLAHQVLSTSYGQGWNQGFYNHEIFFSQPFSSGRLVAPTNVIQHGFKPIFQTGFKPSNYGFSIQHNNDQSSSVYRNPTVNVQNIAVSDFDPKLNEIPQKPLFTPAETPYPAETTKQIEAYQKALREDGTEGVKDITTDRDYLPQTYLQPAAYQPYQFRW